MSTPNITLFPAEGVLGILRTLLSPAPGVYNISNSNFTEPTISYSALFTLTWGLRALQATAGNLNVAPLEVLQNLIALIIQMPAQYITEFENITRIPPDMIAQATVTKITYRAIAQRWTMYVFVAIAVQGGQF